MAVNGWEENGAGPLADAPDAVASRDRSLSQIRRAQVRRTHVEFYGPS